MRIAERREAAAIVPRIARPARREAGGQTALVAGLLILILALLVLPPVGLLLHGAFTDAQGPTWRNFAEALGGRLFLDSLVNTLLFSAGSAVLALLIGWVTAWIVERTNAPLKALAYLTAIISLGTPYILYVTAWLLFFGKAGPVKSVLRRLMRWYVEPAFADQRAFNDAVLKLIDDLDERITRLEHQR